MALPIPPISFVQIADLPWNVTVPVGSANALDSQWVVAAPDAVISMPYSGSIPEGTIVGIQASPAVTTAHPVVVPPKPPLLSGPWFVGPGFSTSSAQSAILGAPGSYIIALFTSQVVSSGTYGSWLVIGGGTDPLWTNLSLATGWTTGSFGYNAAYRVIGDTVQFRGILTNGTGAPSAFPLNTLPATIRPASEINVAVAYPAGMSINPSGNVTLNPAIPIAQGTGIDGVWYSLA